METRPKTVLISPLDWGLGHASRCVPLIRALRGRGWRVVCCSDGAPLGLLKAEFPELETARVASPKIRYPKSGAAMLPAMLLQLPRILLATRAVRVRAEELRSEFGADLLISDNRPGFRARGTRSVYLTHQLRVKAPRGLGMFEGIAERIHAFAARRFDEIWVPDLPGGDSLAGDLSGGGAWPARKLRRIGFLSRFSAAAPDAPERKADSARPAPLLALLSGPEPQRTLFENEIAEQLRKTGLAAVVVRGLPEGAPNASLPVPFESPGVVWRPFAAAEELERLLRSSRAVVARSGYSTLMDLVRTGTRALLVPTPGQTEQEFLAARLDAAGLVRSVPQGKLDLAARLPEAEARPGLGSPEKSALSDGLLERAVLSLETDSGNGAEHDERA